MTIASWGQADKLFGLAVAFTGRVEKTIGHPGRRATLRRALGRPVEQITAFRTHGIVAPHIPTDADRATERAFYAVASLIAAQPRPARDQDANDDQEIDEGVGDVPTSAAAITDESPPIGRRESLGRTMGLAVAAGKLNPDTTESRLHLLCRQSTDGLHRHLPRLIGHLRSDLVPVDWATLLVDLAGWDRARASVIKRWLQDYYRAIHQSRPTTDSPTTEGTTQ